MSGFTPSPRLISLMRAQDSSGWCKKIFSILHLRTEDYHPVPKSLVISSLQTTLNTQKNSMSSNNSTDRSIISKHLQSNFARPQALIQTSSTMPSASNPALHTSTIVIIHLTVVGIFFLLIALGFYIYRRQLRASPDYNAASTLSKTESAMNHQLNLSKESLSTIDEKPELTPRKESTEDTTRLPSIDEKPECNPQTTPVADKPLEN